MENNGGGAEAADAAPTKRTRRPSVRLHEPYYENLPGHSKPHRQINPIKKHSVGVKKPRTVRTALAKNKKNDGPTDAGKGDELRNSNFDDEDDIAIESWRNVNASNRDRDFKRNRVPSDSEQFASSKSRRDGIQENQNFHLSSDAESEKQEEFEDEEEKDDQEENGDGTNSHWVVENTDLSNPISSSGGGGGDDGDGDEKLSGDNNNVNKNKGIEKSGYKNSQDSTEILGGVRIRGGKRTDNGVRAWLTDLGLEKYAPLFDMHEVDDEVLAHLTLEDLKDMGISAVGSRRKMYSSIQKLSKRIS